MKFKVGTGALRCYLICECVLAITFFPPPIHIGARTLLSGSVASHFGDSNQSFLMLELVS